MPEIRAEMRFCPDQIVELKLLNLGGMYTESGKCPSFFSER